MTGIPGPGDVVHLVRQAALSAIEECQCPPMGWPSAWDSTPMERGGGTDSPRGTESQTHSKDSNVDV